MNCLEDETIHDFVHGELGAPALELVDAHLDHCDDCRSLVAALATGSAADGDLAARGAFGLGRGANVGRYLLLEAIGEVLWIGDENLLDAVTAVSGSGPAYVFLLAECLAEAGRAAAIVRKLLDFSRPHDAEFEPTDVVDSIEAALSLRAYEHRVQDISVVRRFADVPRVRADMHRLQQVFLNLIVNAEHAMAGQTRPRTIDIECAAVEDLIEIHFTDSGPGIPEADFDTVFDPFFTTKPVGQGTGLGLSVSFGIIRELGGSIKAVPHGNGARFVIRLPAVRSETVPARPMAPPARADEPVAGGAVNILFVDDEPSLRRVAQRYLSRMGHHVELAADGEEALALLQTRRFDVIVSDLRMPRLGGEELYQRLGTLRVPLQDRFIFMSGDIVNEKTRRFLAGTGRPYLHKPFELRRLASLVRTVADEHDSPD